MSIFKYDIFHKIEDCKLFFPNNNALAVLTTEVSFNNLYRFCLKLSEAHFLKMARLECHTGPWSIGQRSNQRSNHGGVKV